MYSSSQNRDRKNKLPEEGRGKARRLLPVRIAQLVLAGSDYDVRLNLFHLIDDRITQDRIKSANQPCRLKFFFFFLFLFDSRRDNVYNPYRWFTNVLREDDVIIVPREERR
jgi:hypothetical protein